MMYVYYIGDAAPRDIQHRIIFIFLLSIVVDSSLFLVEDRRIPRLTPRFPPHFHVLFFHHVIIVVFVVVVVTVR